MNYSPLRYPGGKSRIAPIVCQLIKTSPNKIVTYYEPFCGGAGVALHLLFNDVVDYVALNDYDRAIYSLWRAIFTNTNELIDKIRKTPINVEEWQKQKKIYLNSNKYCIELAFATLYLNRTNRSGIISSAGPIGGYKQEGKWRIDARYNKEALINKITKIAKFRKRVKINNMDIRRYINDQKFDESCFIFFDPPYVNNSKRLYNNALTQNDHKEIAESVKHMPNCNWIITYDNTELIHTTYSDYCISYFPIEYSAATRKTETELLILKNDNMVDSIRTYISSDPLLLVD